MSTMNLSSLVERIRRENEEGLYSKKRSHERVIPLHMTAEPKSSVTKRSRGRHTSVQRKQSTMKGSHMGGGNGSSRITGTQYTKLLVEFAAQLQRDQRAANPKADIMVTVETGRKYDKMIIITSKNGQAKADVRYFVEKGTGTIFGAKSKVAPNAMWFFGTLATASKWDWGQFHGVPVNDDSVEEVSQYGKEREDGGYRHYRLRELSAV